MPTVKPAVMDVLTGNAKDVKPVPIAPAATPGNRAQPDTSVVQTDIVVATERATHHMRTVAPSDIMAPVPTAHRDARVARPMGASPGHLWREQPRERDAMSGQTRWAAIIPGRLNSPGILIIVTKAIQSRPGGILV